MTASMSPDQCDNSIRYETETGEVLCHVRCGRERGHPGEHQNGVWTWGRFGWELYEQTRRAKEQGK